jgi:hypothetical protein
MAFDSPEQYPGEYKVRALAVAGMAASFLALKYAAPAFTFLSFSKYRGYRNPGNLSIVDASAAASKCPLGLALQGVLKKIN